MGRHLQKQQTNSVISSGLTATSRKTESGLKEGLVEIWNRCFCKFKDFLCKKDINKVILKDRAVNSKLF